MRVFAYCAKSFEVGTRQAARVAPITCPPARADTFNPDQLEGYDLLYFDLHGMPGDPRMYGDEHIVALRADQILEADLKDVIVFASTCYLAEEDSPVMDAFLDAGAVYVIGGDGKNWSPLKSASSGAALLGKNFRAILNLGFEPLWALSLAKQVVRLKLRGSRSVKRDTLAFRAYYRDRRR